MEKSKQAETLEKMIADNHGPVLASFYNDSCEDGVCGVQNNYLDKLSHDLDGVAARFHQINLDQSPEFVEKYQIHTLPSALLFVDGKIHTRFSGLTDPGVLACAVLQQVEGSEAFMASTGNICPIPQVAA